MIKLYVQGQRGKKCYISLCPRGRRMRHVLAPGAVSTWCKSMHRAALGHALADCRTLERRLTKAGIEDAIRQLKPDICGLYGRTKSDLMGTLEGMLIELWFPFHDKER